MSAGTPVIAFGKGGATETIVDHKTGIFFYHQNTHSIINAVNEFAKQKISQEDCIEQARNFSIDKFKKDFMAIFNKIRRENDI